MKPSHRATKGCFWGLPSPTLFSGGAHRLIGATRTTPGVRVRVRLGGACHTGAQGRADGRQPPEAVEESAAKVAVDRKRLQRVEPRPTPRHATTNAPAAPEFEPRDEVDVNHAEMIGVQRFTLMAMLPNKMSNVAEDAGQVTGTTEQAPGPAVQCGGQERR